MTNHYLLRGGRVGWLLLSLWLLATTAQAQAPAWAVVAKSDPAGMGGANRINAMATDASGNIFVTGTLIGQLAFGTTTLTSAGGGDIFVAKYVPTTATWAWAMRAGGRSEDGALGIAVSGTSVYITGQLLNNTANVNLVTFPNAGTAAGPVPMSVLGSTSTTSFDLFVAKYTDTGSGATLNWTQIGGGTGDDVGQGIAVSGTSVYVVGSLTNSLANTNQVVLGGTGTMVGTAGQLGASTTPSADMVLLKYTATGPSATLGWTQVAGGSGGDFGTGIATSGTTLYLTGSLTNNRANSNAVVAGGSGSTPGTVPQYGASTTSDADLFVAKYTDNGANATLGWMQVGGGTSVDAGTAIATSGNNVYVTGYLYNDLANTMAVAFGGSGTTPGTTGQLGATATLNHDLLVAKYTDNGANATLGWTQVGGGTERDYGNGIAVSGRRLFVTGSTYNNLANVHSVVFGGAGLAVGTAPQPGGSTQASSDLLVAAYTDNGATAALNWTQVGGGTNSDGGASIAVAGSSLYVAGVVVPVATFGNFTITTSPGGSISFVGGFANATLASTPAAAALTSRLYPNPAPGPATLSGATAGATVLILDALGRRVATATADASGAAALPAGLPAGLYLVRAGTATVRWIVE